MLYIISSVKHSIDFTKINYRNVVFIKLFKCGDRPGCCRNECRKPTWGIHKGKGRWLELPRYAPALAETNLRSKQASGWIMSMFHKKVKIIEVYKWGMRSNNPSASPPCNILFNSKHYSISSPEENGGDDGKSGRSEPEDWTHKSDPEKEKSKLRWGLFSKRHMPAESNLQMCFG